MEGKKNENEERKKEKTKERKKERKNEWVNDIYNINYITMEMKIVYYITMQYNTRHCNSKEIQSQISC